MSPLELLHQRRVLAVCAALLSLFACHSFGETTEASQAGGDGGAMTDGAPIACDASAPGCDPSCPGGGCTPAPSCRAIHAARAELPDGLYWIAPDNAVSHQPVNVYCDMTTDGGGWTLVARSVPGFALKSGFGWHGAYGVAGDNTQPFSLGVSQVGLAFTEILFGARGSKKRWDAPVYKHAVPTDFLQKYVTTSFKPTTHPSPATVLGTCSPPDGPSMLGVLGHTSIDERFAFYDDPKNPTFGLDSAEWNTNGAYDSEPAKCAYSGALTGKPEMIFVR